MYPSHEDYYKLYARYTGEHGRKEEEFIARAEKELGCSLSGRRVADLCSGRGDLALRCSEKGASVVAVDSSYNMMDQQSLNCAGVKVELCSVQDWLLYEVCKDVERPEVVFCRQGVNYWISTEMVKMLFECMAPDGVFVFNTFRLKPNFNFKKYSIGSVRYVEASTIVGDMVHHIQMCEGFGSHVTEFKWIEPEEFVEMLHPFFEVKRKSVGSTDIYCCKRKMK